MLLTRKKVAIELNIIFEDEVRELLTRGLSRGLMIFERLSNRERQELGFYAGNTSTRNLFSALCRGMEIEIDQSPNLLLKYEQKKKTSSKYIIDLPIKT